jgi:hypothetical protein
MLFLPYCVEFSRRTLAAKSPGAQCAPLMLLAGGGDIVE